ncbi:MAG: trypsin-like serine protease [Deltaproteobacteria bacterium]
MKSVSPVCLALPWIVGAFACGGAPSTSPELAEQETGRATKKLSRLTECDRIEVDNEILGGREVQVERYDFALLSDELVQNEALAQQVGFDAVTSCEDARIVARARVLQPAKPVIELPEEAVDYPTEDNPNQTSRGLWVGDPIGDQRWLHVRIPVSLGDPEDAALDAPTFNCTAIPISENHILTSAHCIPPGAEGWWRVRVMRADPSGSDIGEPVQVGNYRVFIYQHENWTGTGDTGDDIAILSMHRGCITSNERDAIDLCSGSYWQRYYNNNRVWLGNLSLGITMDLYGFGSRSRYSQTSPRLHEPPNGARISVDWTGSRHFLTDDETTAIVCKGDSGGPAVLHQDAHDLVAGVLSNGTFYDDQFCTKNTGIAAYRKQRWHRLSGTFSNWIEPKLGGNGQFTCPSNGATCCNRYNSVNAYTNLANHSFARCW